MDISAENGTLLVPHIRADPTFASLSWIALKSNPEFWTDSAVVFTLFLFGLPLNAWILWLILRDTKGLVGSDIFALNLAAVEAYYCLVAPAYWFSIYFSNLSGVLFYVFSLGLFVSGGSLFKCCICVERYLAVVHPITYLKYKPVRYRVTCSGTVWLLASVFGGYSLYEFPLFPFYPFCVICFFVLALSVFSSVAILKVLRQPGPGEGEREEMNLMKRRAFKMVFIILVMTVLSYFPFPTVGILYKEGLFSEEYFYIAYSTTLCLFMSSSLVQPLLYLTSAGKLPCLQQCWGNRGRP